MTATGKGSFCYKKHKPRHLAMMKRRRFPSVISSTYFKIMDVTTFNTLLSLLTLLISHYHEALSPHDGSYCNYIAPSTQYLAVEVKEIIFQTKLERHFHCTLNTLISFSLTFLPMVIYSVNKYCFTRSDAKQNMMKTKIIITII